MRTRPLLAAFTLWQRELVRFIRQRNRVLGAVGQPVLFWMLFSWGLGPTFRLPQAGGVSFGEYFFPGTAAMILLFTAIFSTVSIIEDRHEGFLQAVLVSPAPRWAMVLGKLLGGATLAVGQALLFLSLGALFGVPVQWTGVLMALPLMLLAAMGLTGLGFVLAWKIDSPQGFHAVINLVLVPMWLLSGAFFPTPPGFLGRLMQANPMTYVVAGLRRLMYFGSSGTETLVEGLPSLAVCWPVTGGFAMVLFAASCWIARERSVSDWH